MDFASPCEHTVTEFNQKVAISKFGDVLIIKLPVLKVRNNNKNTACDKNTTPPLEYETQTMKF